MREKKGKRLPSYDDLIEAAQAIAAADAGAAALVGGLAMQIWGSPRLTGDLDVIAENNLGYDGSPLSFGGIRTIEGTVPLDVIIRSDEWAPLYDESLKGAVRLEDIPLPVVTPEYLVAMKMVAGRQKDESDVRYLTLIDDFDLGAAEEIVREHLGRYAVRELHSLMAEARWRRDRGDE